MADFAFGLGVGYLVGRVVPPAQLREWARRIWRWRNPPDDPTATVPA